MKRNALLINSSKVVNYVGAQLPLAWKMENCFSIPHFKMKARAFTFDIFVVNKLKVMSHAKEKKLSRSPWPQYGMQS